MPILSIYLGRSEVSFLIFNSPEDYKVYNYPYSLTEPDFIKELIKVVSKELKTPNLSKYDLLMCGFPEVPKIDTEPKLSITLDKVATGIKEFYPVFMSNFSILTASSFLSVAKLEYVDISMSDFFPNLSIYPYLLPSDSLEQFTLDNFIRFFPADLTAHNINVPMVFSGERFGFDFSGDPLSYMLIIDLVKSLGFYELRHDPQNIVANLSMIAKYDEKYSNLLADFKFLNLGYLVNAPGTVEGLLETESGTRQFFEVGSDKLFLIPLAEEHNRVVIKSSVLGNIEKTVSGGKLGLIIDTRPKSNPQIFNDDYVEKGLNVWTTSLREVISSL
ncbi:MAG TPA: hypothetical protein VJG85_00940 [Patescibacteria group bacterium]|nr:hypothetical protein [Patescibacteria group bacterium]